MRGVQEWQSVIESGLRARRREEREECETGRTEWGERVKSVCFLAGRYLVFDDFTYQYDFSWDVLKFTISTFHFMLCFEHLTKKVSILWCVLRATVAKYCKIHRWFFGISDSMMQKHMFWASPRRGDGRTHGRTDGGIISFELSPLKRCMRTRGTCAQAHEKELSVQLPAFLEGFLVC